MYNTLDSACRHGVKRFVFASSHHAVGYYRRAEKIDGTVPPRPDSRYGAAKVFGEALCRLYADKYGMSTLCLRIGSFQPRPLNPRMISTWVSHRDMVQLTRVCLEAPLDVHFEVVYGVSGNDRSLWDNAAAERLGYKPEDNGEDYAEEILAEAAKAAAEAPAEAAVAVSSSMTHEDVVAAVEAKPGVEPENARLFHGGPFCGMEFTGDLSKIK
jgi:uronate dehydrogenase